MRALRAHLSYARYVLRHKWFVFQACRTLGVPFWQAVVHDWSKFLPSEWVPYVRFFYGLPKVGDVVEIQSYEGFGGPARIVEERRSKTNRYKVEMLDGSQPRPFWAHDFEVKGLERAKAAFDVAWNLHQKRQLHHWQYWLLTLDSGETTPLPMPERFVREMVADWVGAGRAITGRIEVAEWYAKNRDRIQLEIRTRALVEGLIERYYPTSPQGDTFTNPVSVS